MGGVGRVWEEQRCVGPHMWSRLASKPQGQPRPSRSVLRWCQSVRCFLDIELRLLDLHIFKAHWSASTDPQRSAKRFPVARQRHENGFTSPFIREATLTRVRFARTKLPVFLGTFFLFFYCPIVSLVCSASVLIKGRFLSFSSVGLFHLSFIPPPSQVQKPAVSREGAVVHAERGVLTAGGKKNMY